MALSLSPSIVNNGLVFHYDMKNPRGYVGPPLTNILPNGINAGYPTSPTGWGTYNTNQYGSGTYFSIGTITDVTNNIVTCPNHLLRTYDVVQPQTTGGGVTAGTNYLVRKWNSNTFSLYGYDSTQDSTDIFQTHVNLNSDNRVSVSSGITNMWWGYPHLPNSGIMKQTITNGFKYKGRIHDCIRIHWYRPDGVTDGMAYGNEPTITAGQTYTISFYHRAATPNCVGYSATINRWTNGEYTSDSFTVGKNWKKHSYTFTTSQSGSTYFYWFNGNMPAQCAWDLSEIMIYQGSGSSEYVPSNTTRSNTQAIYDLTNNNTITAQSLTYNSDGTFSFNGSDVLTIPNSSAFNMTEQLSIEAWVKFSGNSDDFIFEKGDVNTQYSLFSHGTDIVFRTFHSGDGSYHTQGPSKTTAGIVNGQWVHIVGSWDGVTKRIYVNGVLKDSVSKTGALVTTSKGSSVGRFGGDTTGYYFNGSIAKVAVYNIGLTESQVLQNFNAQRGIYGI